jgi:hypothetical protein
MANRLDDDIRPAGSESCAGTGAGARRRIRRAPLSSNSGESSTTLRILSAPITPMSAVSTQYMTKIVGTFQLKASTPTRGTALVATSTRILGSVQGGSSLTLARLPCDLTAPA